MVLITDLPMEIILKIAYLLDMWNDIHCFSSVIRILRKFRDYAVYARMIFEIERENNSLWWETAKTGRWGVRHTIPRCIHSRIMNIGDDRIRTYANPNYDDRVIELWRVEYTWVDYRAKFYIGEQTSLTWIHLPYGGIFDGFQYYPTADIHIKSSAVL